MATRTISNAGGNWNALATWVEGAVPTTADQVVATATSGNVTINVTNAVCGGLDLTGYVGTLTFTAGQFLTVSGNVILVATMTYAGSGTLRCSGTSSITTNGVSISGSFGFTSNNTFTLVDDLVILGSYSQVSGFTITANRTDATHGNIYVHGGFTIPSGTLRGTAVINMVGTGNFTASGGTLQCSVIINTAGTITMSSSFFYNTGTFQYVAGTIAGSPTLVIQAAVTLDTDGMAFGGINAATSGTITLASDLTTGTLQSSNNSNVTFGGAFDITCTTLTILSGTWQLVSGTTLTVTTALNLTGTITVNPLLRAVTASSSAFLNFTGAAGDCKIWAFAFTDIDASGSTMRLDNWHGSTLTRTANIANRTSVDLNDLFGITS
jgi:hypothetical protein